MSSAIAISGALEDLSKDDLNKFCHWLLNRKGPPQVRRRQVENKTYLEISDLLVSTFTEAGALKVCVEILREIGCNNEAESLVKATSVPVAVEDSSDSEEPPSSSSDSSDSEAELCKHVQSIFKSIRRIIN